MPHKYIKSQLTSHAVYNPNSNICKERMSKSCHHSIRSKSQVRQLCGYTQEIEYSTDVHSLCHEEQTLTERSVPGNSLALPHHPDRPVRDAQKQIIAASRARTTGMCPNIRKGCAWVLSKGRNGDGGSSKEMRIYSSSSSSSSSPSSPSRGLLVPLPAATTKCSAVPHISAQE